MLAIKTIQVKVSDEAYNLYENIIAKETSRNPDLKKKDVMEKILNQYVIPVKSNNEDDSMELLMKIYESVMLLIKVNKDLPKNSEKEEMERFVNNASRFEKMIEEKVKKK